MNGQRMKTKSLIIYTIILSYQYSIQAYIHLSSLLQFNQHRFKFLPIYFTSTHIGYYFPAYFEVSNDVAPHEQSAPKSYLLNYTNSETAFNTFHEVSDNDTIVKEKCSILARLEEIDYSFLQEILKFSREHCGLVLLFIFSRQNQNVP